MKIGHQQCDTFHLFLDTSLSHYMKFVQSKMKCIKKSSSIVLVYSEL